MDSFIYENQYPECNNIIYFGPKYITGYGFSNTILKFKFKKMPFGVSSQNAGPLPWDFFHP
jgi:hypothetical protein